MKKFDEKNLMKKFDEKIFHQNLMKKFFIKIDPDEKFFPLHNFSLYTTSNTHNF